MSNFKPMAVDLTNRRFGRLTAVRRDGSYRSFAVWIVRCDCGNEKRVISRNLTSGSTRSCGCYARELATQQSTTHGLTGTSGYNTWMSMRARCYLKSCVAFHNYGGRGIRMCRRWKSSVENFIADMGPRPPPKHTVERINNNKGYSPQNCRWATYKEQANNQRVNVVVRFEGQRMTLTQWAEKLGVGCGTLRFRLKAGWPIRRAFTQPVQLKNRRRFGNAA